MKIEYCQDNVGDLTVAYTRGHVDKATFEATVLAEAKLAPHPAETVKYSWWRMVPVLGKTWDVDTRYIAEVFPAAANSRGAFPVTEVMA